MVRPRTETLTPREAQIMQLLWGRGPCTAEEIRLALPDDPHDSTVRTLLRTLEAKRYVRHAKAGKAFTYVAAVPREQAERKVLRSVLKRFFSGSAEALVLRLIQEEYLTPEQLDEIRRQSGKP